MLALTRHHKFRKSRCSIKFTIERPLGKQEQQYLGGRAHNASMRDMTAHHSTLGIGDAHMEVRSIAGNCSCQSQDFKITAQVIRFVRSGKAQSRNTETADRRNYETRTTRVRCDYGRKGRAHVSTRREPQGKRLHGVSSNGTNQPALQCAGEATHAGRPGREKGQAAPTRRWHRPKRSP